MHSKQAKMIVCGPLQHPNMGTKFESNESHTMTMKSAYETQNSTERQ